MKLGVADYGMLVWYGNHYDYDERIKTVRELGYDGLERLYPTSAEDALRKVATLKKLGMSFATCNSSNAELAIKWTAALGGEYVWADVQGHTFDAYLRQLNEMAKVCNGYGIDVVVHNHLGTKAETQEQVETILEKCPDVKLLFDVGHMAVAGGNVRHIMDTYYDRISAYHLKGWTVNKITSEHELWFERGFFCGLEQGDFFIDNEYVFKETVKRGFDGWVFIEQDTHLRDPKLDLAENIKVLKRWKKEVIGC